MGGTACFRFVDLAAKTRDYCVKVRERLANDVLQDCCGLPNHPSGVARRGLLLFLDAQRCLGVPMICVIFSPAIKICVAAVFRMTTTCEWLARGVSQRICRLPQHSIGPCKAGTRPSLSRCEGTSGCFHNGPCVCHCTRDRLLLPSCVHRFFRKVHGISRMNAYSENTQNKCLVPLCVTNRSITAKHAHITRAKNRIIKLPMMSC